MDAKIPFSGFYESKWSRGCDDEGEQIAEQLAEEHSLKKDEIAELIYKEAKYREAYEYVAEKYVGYFENWLNSELGLNIKLTFNRMTSPREYNFETDDIHVNISYEDAIKLARRVGRNALRKAAKELFTSRDGFISFYRNDPAEWGRLRGWDENHLYAVFTAAVDVIGEDDWEWGLVEVMSGNGVFSTAFDRAFDSDAVMLEIGKIIGRRELAEELEEETDRNFPEPGKFHDTKSYVAQYEALNKSVFKYPGTCSEEPL